MNKSSPLSLLKALRWIMATPPLFTQAVLSSASSIIVSKVIPDGFSLPAADHPGLQTLADTLHSKERLRLGIYYEALWHCLLDLHPECTLLAHNLPVRTRKNNTTITLGEFDLIYQYRQRIFHRELAVKFYLGVPLSEHSAIASAHHFWVGPGLKDRLDRKVQHTLNHQINLSDTAEAQPVLSTIGVHSPVKEVLMQGRLFYPLEGYCPAPEHSHPDHLTGLWMTRSQWQHWHRQNRIDRFFIPEKRQWISFMYPENWLSAEQLLTALNASRQPQQVFTPEQCVFIVPDQWPEKAYRKSVEQW